MLVILNNFSSGPYNALGDKNCLEASRFPAPGWPKGYSTISNYLYFPLIAGWICGVSHFLRKDHLNSVVKFSSSKNISKMLLGREVKHKLYNDTLQFTAIAWYTRMWYIISSAATTTVCLEQKSENFQSRNVTLSMPSSSKNNCIWHNLLCCLLFCSQI